VPITWAAGRVIQQNRIPDNPRQPGRSHNAAIRALAFKWIRILWRCWTHRQPYDEGRYLITLQKRHTPVVALAATTSSRPRVDGNLVDFAPSAGTTDWIFWAFLDHRQNVANGCSGLLRDPHSGRSVPQQASEPLHDLFLRTWLETVWPLRDVKALDETVQDGQMLLVSVNCCANRHVHIRFLSGQWSGVQRTGRRQAGAAILCRWFCGDQRCNGISPRHH
jgi:hypothetical protein